MRRFLTTRTTSSNQTAGIFTVSRGRALSPIPTTPAISPTAIPTPTPTFRFVFVLRVFKEAKFILKFVAYGKVDNKIYL